ncbi:peroxidase [Trichonephila clavipes]|nr:peroxidase [Trichonephila clavipes]
MFLFRSFAELRIVASDVELGDGRVNQHATLTSIHTLYMREHNRLATILKLLNPQWDEEQLFQEARRINIAQIQCITYKEYLPYVIGPYLMEQFYLEVKDGPEGTLYNPCTRPGIVNEFSTSAFRLHSMVASNVGALQLLFEDLYSNPKLIWDGHMNQLMQGVSRVPSAKYDHWFVKDITVSLRRPPGKAYGSDLSSMDIQRGRDTGLAPYIYLVRFCSGNRYKITSFEDLSPLMSIENIKLLKKSYKSVSDVDLEVGLHMENHLPEAEVGPTTACIIAKQFYLIKFGDRFYFEHVGEAPSFTPDQRNALKQCSFSRLLCDNTNIPRIQKNVMLVPDTQSNPKVPCNEIPEIDLSLWKEEKYGTTKAVTGSTYLDALQPWLLPQLEESEPNNFIWQQDGAQPHWHLSERDCLNITVPNQRIGHKEPSNISLHRIASTFSQSDAI